MIQMELNKEKWESDSYVFVRLEIKRFLDLHTQRPDIQVVVPTLDINRLIIPATCFVRGSRTSIGICFAYDKK